MSDNYERDFSRKPGSHHLTGCGSFVLATRGTRGAFCIMDFGFAGAAKTGAATGGTTGRSSIAKRACKLSSAA